MKKLLILLVFVMTLTVSYAQTDSTKYVTNSDTEKLIDKYTDKVSSAITSLAEQLKQPAEHVYKVLVKKQTINAYCWLGGILFSFILAILIWVAWFFDKDGKDEWWGVPAFFTLICLVLCLFGTGYMLNGFINPEYGAIKEIIEFIK